jgi:hypothetical protein
VSPEDIKPGTPLVEEHHLDLVRAATKTEKRLPLVGTLIILGLLVEAGSLAWHDPLAFVIFLGAGVLLVGLGIAIYLLTLSHVF